MYIIYGLYEAGEPENIQYVGCTSGTLARRLAAHQGDAVKGIDRPVTRWLVKTVAAGTVVEGRVLQHAKHRLEALEFEWEWIVLYARQGKTLLNVRRNSNSASKPQFASDKILHYF